MHSDARGGGGGQMGKFSTNSHLVLSASNCSSLQTSRAVNLEQLRGGAWSSPTLLSKGIFQPP